RCRTKIVRRIDVRSRANQQVCAFDIVAITRPVQRRCTVTFGDVDVRAFLQKGLERVPVAVPRRIKKRRPDGPKQHGSRHDDTNAQRKTCRNEFFHMPDNVSNESLPSLPPTFSTGTPILSISVTSRLAIDGFSLYTIWRPPLRVP